VELMKKNLLEDFGETSIFTIQRKFTYICGISYFTI